MRFPSILVACVLAVGLAESGCKRDAEISRDLGATCVNGLDCTDRCLPGPRWPAGFCTRDCTRPEDCPTGSTCALTGDGNVCLYACFDDKDCSFLNSDISMGWGCTQVGPDLVCVPKYAADGGP